MNVSLAYSRKGAQNPLFDLKNLQSHDKPPSPRIFFYQYYVTITSK